MDGFQIIFADAPDPRDFTARHDLTEILFIALAASLCGADDCVAWSVIRKSGHRFSGKITLKQ